MRCIGREWIASDTDHRQLVISTPDWTKAPRLRGFLHRTNGHWGLGRSGGSREKSAGLAGEAPEDSLAGRNFDEMKDSQREQDQDDVGEPWIQSGEMKTFRYVIGVEELEDIEVQEIKAVTALANQEERAP